MLCSKRTPSLCISHKIKIEHPAVQRQSQNAVLVEATRMVTRQERLRSLQNGAVGASGSSSNGLPDNAAVVTNAELRGAVANDGAVSCALA